MSEIRKLLKQSSHYFTGHVIIMAAGFISFPLLTRIFSVDEYGTMALITTTFFIIAAIGKFGFPSAIVQFYARFRSNRQGEIFNSTMFITSLAISLTIAGIFLIVVSLLRNGMLNEYGGSILYLVSPLLLFFCTTDIITSFLRAEEKTKLFNLVGVIRKYGSIFFGIFFALYVVKGLYGLFFGQLLSGMIIFFLLLRFFIKSGKLNFKTFSMDIFGESIRFGFPIMLAELGHLTLNYIDRYLVVFYLGSMPLGLYTAGYNLSTYVTDIVTYPLAYAVTPIYVGILLEKGELKTKEFLSKTLRYFLLIVIPISLGFIALSRDFITILAPNKYMESNAVVPYVVIGQSVYACSLVLNNGLFIKRKTYIVTVVMLLISLLNVGLNILLIPIFGIVGAAQATLISYVAYTVIITYYSFKEFRFEISYGYILLYVAVALVMFITVKDIQLGSGPINVVAKFGAGILIYAGLILILDGEIRRKSLGLIKSLSLGKV